MRVAGQLWHWKCQILYAGEESPSRWPQRPPGVGESAFAEQCASVDEEIGALKALLESRDV